MKKYFVLFTLLFSVLLIWGQAYSTPLLIDPYVMLEYRTYDDALSRSDQYYGQAGITLQDGQDAGVTLGATTLTIATTPPQPLQQYSGFGLSPNDIGFYINTDKSSTKPVVPPWVVETDFTFDVAYTLSSDTVNLQKTFTPTGAFPQFKDAIEGYGYSGNTVSWDEDDDSAYYKIRVLDMDWDWVATSNAISGTSLDLNSLNLSAGAYYIGVEARNAWVEDGVNSRSIYFSGVDFRPIPEPTTMVLFGLGILGLAGVSRRKQ